MADHPSGSEFDIISKYFRPLSEGSDEALGLTDDAALLSVPEGHQLVVTTDAIVAGVHFLETLSPEDIAYKVVGVNLSDLAAMGARPHAVFLAAQFSPGVAEDWIASFAAGLKSALAPSGAKLLGGDTVSTPGPMAFTITALGFVRAGRALTRAGAREGDLVLATGTIGDGALGLAVLQGDFDGLDAAARDHLARRYARPEPRWEFAQELVKRGLAHAAVDVSDGLVADLGHICEASGVSAIIEAEQVQLSAAARAVLMQAPERLGDVLTGGDDYELVFTAAESALSELEDLAATMSLPLSVIGRIEPMNPCNGPRVQVLDTNGLPMRLRASGYRHL
ncbi:thiamine-phosphate kinase [Magnetovibrio sp.]|uniref:thiamine-phosphate kinase n=1 Tax=Magnetovibrio sp. TaxID=2024836 RepID=UPI002F92F018